ncbi:DDE-type integrase/transposase/recombinase [Bizionia sp.]|uniref:DDE-type integrase/transposase/recombinase n=1 Tax=Bizionia sp. TaxID=1954480 RepID=UPI003A94CEDC
MKSPIIKKIDGYIYVSFTFLIENGFNKGTLNNLISKYRNGDSLAFITHKDSKSQKKFIQYKSIPLKHLQKHNLPSEEEDLEKILNSSLPKKLNSVTNRELDFIMEQTWLQKTYWVQYVPHYKDYFTDSEQIVLYSKTHAVIALILKCKDRNIWSMKDMFYSYMKLSKAIFKTSNLKYFYEKINDCNKKGIPETLVHNFRINGREPYKAIPIIKGIIKSYYVRKKCYSISIITTYVNTELGHRSLNKVSESTVRNICNDLEFKNRADSIRYGNKYAENKLLPYLSRVNTREIGDQYQCDTCKVNFPYKSGNEVKFLRVCAVMDQFSRKIVGYSFGEVENTILILEAIRNTFNKNEVIPRQLLIDNHSSYHSILFTNFEALIEEYGVVVRKARVRNPKDKGNVEVWFDKFQTNLLKDLYGNLGAGVKTYTDGKRMEEDVINVYYDKKNLSTLNRLKNILEEKIQAYNSSFLKLVDSSPNNLFENRKKNNSIKKFTKPDISYLFDQYKKIKVKRSKIIFQVNGRKYHYCIFKFVNNKTVKM